MFLVYTFFGILFLLRITKGYFVLVNKIHGFILRGTLFVWTNFTTEQIFLVHAFFVSDQVRARRATLTLYS